MAAVIAFQMLTEVSLQLCGQSLPVPNRTSGALTGTRVAGQLGRIPIEAAMREVHGRLMQCGLPVFAPTHLAEKCKPEYVNTSWEPFCVLTFASYVDNVFILAKDVPSFLKLAKDFEHELLCVWNQTIKASNKQFLVPKGVLFGKVNLNEWQFCKQMKCLGVTIQHNGETNLTWEDIEKTAWKI